MPERVQDRERTDSDFAKIGLNPTGEPTRMDKKWLKMDKSLFILFFISIYPRHKLLGSFAKLFGKAFGEVCYIG